MNRTLCRAICLSICCLILSPARAAGTRFGLKSTVKAPQILFAPNVGQFHPSVLFASQSDDHAIAITATDTYLTVRKSVQPTLQRGPKAARFSKQSADVVKMRVAGARRGGRARGLAPVAAKANYFLGNDPSKWRSNVQLYSEVVSEGSLSGVGLKFYGNQGSLEYDILVPAGQDPGSVELEFEGHSSIELLASGDLAITTPGGRVLSVKPRAYQTDGDRQSVVPCSYRKGAGGRIGFNLGTYNRTRPVTIDPILEFYSGVVTGALPNFDAVAVDFSESIFVHGQTMSGFTATTGPFVGSGNTLFDSVYVTKRSPQDGSVIWSTYLGGNGFENPGGIGVDLTGNVWITGITDSTTFPLSQPLQSTFSNGTSAYITKLSPDGAGLLFSTFYGDSHLIRGTALVIDRSTKQPVVAGYGYFGAQSESIPVVNAFQPSKGGGDADYWVAKLTETGSSFVFSSYFGGSSHDAEQGGLAISFQNGDVLLTGNTGSPDFPVTIGPPNSFGTSGFLIRLGSTGVRKWSRLVVPAQGEVVSVGADAFGYAYVTGRIPNGFATPGAFQESGSFGDCFAAKIRPDGSGFDYLTYFGGSAADIPIAIAVRTQGDAFVYGTTNSTDFPVVDAVQTAHGGPIFAPGSTFAGRDAFLTWIDSDGRGLTSSTFLGGVEHDDARSLVADFAGRLYLSMTTKSRDIAALNYHVPSVPFAGNVLFAALDPLATRPSFSYLAADPSLAGESTNVSLTFSALTPLRDRPEVNLNGQAATYVTSSFDSTLNSTQYVYQIAITQAVGSGTPTMTVRGVSPAGIAGTSSANPLTVDLAKPTFGSFSANPTPVRLGMTTNVSFTSSKPLRDRPSVVVGSETAYYVSESSLTYTFGVTATAAVGHGSPVVRVTGADVAGNVGTATAQPLETDFLAPSFSGITAIPAAAGLNVPVSIVFTASETLQPEPAVTVGGVAATKSGQSGLTYTYRVTTSALMGENRPPVQITGLDLIGNFSSQAPASPLITDFSVPQIFIGATPSTVNEGTPVQFSSSGSTAISGISSMQWTFGDGVSATTANPSHPYDDGLGTKTVTLNVTSGVGAAASAQMLVTVRNVSPTVTLAPLPSPASRELVPITWSVFDPGIWDTHTYSLVARDLVTGIESPLAIDKPSTGLFVWETRAMAESLYQLVITVTDKDGGASTASSNPTVVDNARLSIRPFAPDPAIFNPTFGETTDFNYLISEAATTRVDLTRPGQQSSLANLQSDAPVPSGLNTVVWNGRNPVDNQIMADGQYAYAVTGTDRLARTVTENSGAQGFTITLHTGAPRPPTITTTPASPTNMASVNLSGGKDPNSQVTVFLGGSPVFTGALDALQTWSGTVSLSEGSNSLSIVADNRIGQRSAPTTVTLVLDTVAPAPVFVNPPNSPTNSPTQQLSGSKELGTKLFMNGDLFPSFTTAAAWSVDVAYKAGVNGFTFVQEDDAGNRSPSRRVDIDLTPNSIAAPTIDPFISPRSNPNLPLSGTKSANTRVEITVQGVTDSTFVRKSIVPSDAGTSWAVAVALPAGASSIVAQSFDSIDSPSVTTMRSATLDSVMPTIQVAGIADGESTSSANLSLSVLFADPPPGTGVVGSSFRIALDNQDITSQATVGTNSANLSLVNLTAGAHALEFSASDVAGNVQAKTIAFYRWTDDGVSVPTLSFNSGENLEFTPDNVFTESGPLLPQVRFTLSEPAALDVVVLSQTNTVVASYQVPQGIPNREGIVTFNGQTDSGEYVAPGRYTIRVTPRNAAGRLGQSRDIECEVYY